MLTGLGLLALILYLGSAWRAWRGSAGVRLLPALALAAHAGALALQIFHAGGLRLGMAEALSLFAWQSAATLWVFALREASPLLAVVLYPAVGLAALLGTLVSNAGGDVIPIADWRLQVHVLLSLFAAGILTLACLHALALAALDRVLHRRAGIGLARRLPPLQRLEQLLFRLLAVGFFLLSLALLAGLLFIHNLWAQHLAPKTFLSLAAWLIFGVLLWGRRRYGWRGRTAIRWALSGYAVLLLAYFGSKLFIEQVLGTHWT
ncbi:MAG: cytochrome c biogenesis protein CcsA [Gammaproteobacteria bacterium]|nr:cytochrome c biogenesis protein CcsA [Gammaproteobacteria bacterium]